METYCITENYKKQETKIWPLVGLAAVRNKAGGACRVSNNRRDFAARCITYLLPIDFIKTPCYIFYATKERAVNERKLTHDPNPSTGTSRLTGCYNYTKTIAPELAGAFCVPQKE